VFKRKHNWGWKLRMGLFETTDQDSAQIAQAMNVTLPIAIEESADANTRLPDLPRRSGGRRA